jgi:hypothetical protein
MAMGLGLKTRRIEMEEKEWGKVNESLYQKLKDMSDDEFTKCIHWERVHS